MAGGVETLRLVRANENKGIINGRVRPNGKNKRALVDSGSLPW